MKTRTINNRIVSAILALCLAVIACNGINFAPASDVQTETQSVELGSASSANVQISMQAGELTVSGGAEELMQATFEYNVADWKPQVSYSLNGSQGELVVNQPSDTELVNANAVNTWNIQLTNTVPLDLEIQTGAGESTLDLSDLDLTALRIATGAGNVNVDLTGAWNHDLNATIDGGVGSLSVKLPGDIGVQVNADVGLGNVTATGLVQQGNTYVNQAFGTSPYTLVVDINAGVGSIELVAP